MWQEFLRILIPWWFPERGPDPPSSPTSCAPVVPSFTFTLSNGLRTTLKNDEIAEVDADVIAVGNDVALSNHGKAAESLWRQGGPSYQESLMQLRQEQSANQRCVLRCDKGDLRYCRKKVYHAIVNDCFKESDMKAWKKQLRELYDTICRMAQEDQVGTLAVVLIGAGKAGGPTRESVRAALKAFSRLPAPGCLTQLLLVERDERTARKAVEECQDWAKKHPPPPQSAPSQNPPPPPSDNTSGNPEGDGEQSDTLETGGQANPLEELGAVGGYAGDDEGEANDVTNPADPTLQLLPGPGDIGNDVTGAVRRNRGQRIQFADL